MAAIAASIPTKLSIPMHDYHDITSKQLLEGKVSRAEQAELEKNKRQLIDVLSRLS